MDAWIVEPADRECRSAHRVGRKAVGLARLRDAGLRVPDWFVVQTGPHEEFVSQALDEHGSGLWLELPQRRAWERFAQRVRSEPPSAPAGEHGGTIIERARELAETGCNLVVRSSANVEDTHRGSMAGVFTSQTDVEPRGVPEAVRDVWLSMFSEEAVARMLETGVDPRLVRMGVIVQRQVPADAGGVFFTRSPGQDSERVVEWVRGSPERVVEGGVEPERAVFEEAQAPPEPAFLQELEGRADRFEQIVDGAADVEWTWNEEGLWTLQARPVSRSCSSERDADETVPEGTWLSWFFNQRFDRPLTPITRTLLLPPIAERAVLEPLELVGVDPDADTEITCLHQGRFYVRADAYAAMLDLVPEGILPTDLEGVRSIARSADASAGLADRRSLAGLLRGLVEVSTSPEAYPFLNLDRWARLRDDRPDPPDPGRPEPGYWLNEIDRRLAWSERFLSIHRFSIVYADVFHSLHESVVGEPYRPREIRTPTAACNALINEALDQGWDPNGDRPEAARELLDRFGHRAFGLELGIPSWRMRPDLLRDFVDTFEPVDASSRESESEGGSRGVMSRVVRKYTREFVLAREEQRFVWEEVLEGIRIGLRRLGDRLVDGGILEHASNVFFLEIEELREAIESEGSGRDIGDRIRERRADWYRWDQTGYPAVLEPADGTPSSRVSFARSLDGLGVSGGVARGSAIVASHGLDLPQIREDSVLVTPTLDPGWTSVLSQISALVTTRGGMLSHAAILARETGTPCVVVPGLDLDEVQEDATLEVDGDEGVVRVV